MSNPPYKCQGLLGWIFGHKWFLMFEPEDNCLRCGMPRGGWK